MKKYLITYDLKNKHISNYEQLFLNIKKLGPWWHYLESTWIIKSELSANDIWNSLKGSILSNDYILIIEIERFDIHSLFLRQKYR